MDNKYNRYLKPASSIKPPAPEAGLVSNHREHRRNIDPYKTMNIQMNYEFQDTNATSNFEKSAYQTPAIFENLKPLSATMSTRNIKTQQGNRTRNKAILARRSAMTRNTNNFEMHKSCNFLPRKSEQQFVLEGTGFGKKVEMDSASQDSYESKK